eukprot:TRINITY_DN910_c0_g1_i2.p1 TRINITY_DN910_c0_g1~~TRINITY_DN910_c0_g1_i2.p1  ORF type:complete len:1078 (-),score=315.91 TRINITY_DN910_c0_g1_i2:356-3589(-)
MSLSTPTMKPPSRGERSQNIQVFVRVRPLNESEKASRSYSVLEAVEGKRIVVKEKSNSSLTKTYSFNGVFEPEVPQGPVYARVVKPLIEQVMMGYNCTVFAYGQTGTGKTFTMEGVPESPKAGVVPRALNDLFDGLRVSAVKDYAIRVSYLELYNEEIFDLLSDVSDASRLRLYEDAQKKGSIIIQGLEELQVNSKEEVLRVLRKGSLKRQTAATLMNAKSSRSHTVFTVTVLMNQSAVGDEETLKVGKLNLVDLAGSENVGRSGAIDKRAREAGNINQSLLTLGRVISSLVERTPHVPYRESKLTRLLQDSLGGRTKTSIIATVSPALINLEETLSTLDYAHRAKSITNKPEINQRITKNEKLLEYTNHIDRLKSELQAAREKSGVYLTKDNYLDLIKKDDSQEKEITELIQKISFLEKECDKIKEMFDQTKSCLEDTTKERDETRDLLDNTKNVLSQTTAEKEEQEYLVSRYVETESKLKSQASTLLTVSDESTRDLSGVHDKLDRIRKLDSDNETSTKKFQSSFQSRYNQLEDSFQSHIQDQSRFCTQSRDSLSSLLRERNSHKEETSQGFQVAMDSLGSLISGLQESLTHSAGEEQSWIDSQLSSARSAADTQQKKLKTYLMNKVLPELASISTAIADQKAVTLEASTQIHALVNSQVDRWEKYVEDQKDLNAKSLNLIREVGLSREKHLSDLEDNQKSLKVRNESLSSELATLLSSVESFSLRVKSHTSEAQKEATRNSEIIQAVRSEGSKMISGAETLADTSKGKRATHLSALSEESSAIKHQTDALLVSMNETFEIIIPADEVLATEARTLVASATEDSEKNYSEMQRSLKHKSNTTATHLNALTSKAQDMISCTVDSQRSLETRLESHRSQDKSQTHTLIKSIDEHCLSTESFGKSHGEELRSSGLNVTAFLSEELQRDTPTHQTPIRKPPRAYPAKIHSGTPDPVRLQRFRDLRASSLLTEEEDEEKKDNDHQASDDVDSVISRTTMKSEDLASVDEDMSYSKENVAPSTAQTMSLSRQNSKENEAELSGGAKSAIPVMNNAPFRRPLGRSAMTESRSRSASNSRKNS